MRISGSRSQPSARMQPLERVCPIGRGGFPRGHIAHETAAADDVGSLRRHAFVVEGERAQARPVLQPRVAHHVDDFRAVAQPAELVEREKTHAGVVGFAAQHAIELDGVADGFVDLQTELRAVQNQVEFAFGTLIGGVQRHGLFSHARSVFEQAQLFHQLVPLQLVLAAERIGIGAPLDLAILIAEGRKTGAAEAAGLVDETPQRGCEDLAAGARSASTLPPG
jgi:hypothetical protein